MPPKKSGLGRKAPNTKAKSTERANQDEEKQEQEARQAQVRMESRRRNESSESREMRRATDRARQQQSRSTETEQQSGLRQLATRLRNSFTRRNETPQERTARLEDKAQRNAQQRATETPQQRTVRLEDNAQRNARQRATETPQQRTARLEDNAQRNAQQRALRDEYDAFVQRQADRERKKRDITRKRGESLFSIEKAAFNYNRSNRYSLDKAIVTGGMDYRCNFCGSPSYKDPLEPKGFCCSNGKVVIPPESKPYPASIRQLYLRDTPQGRHFTDNCRQYNSAFQMTSFGTSQKIVHFSRWSSTFSVQGQIMHKIGSLLPNTEQPEGFLQVYFIDNKEQQVGRRCELFSSLRQDNVELIQQVLHEENALIRDFKYALQIFQSGDEDMRIVVSADKRPRGEHARRYNSPVQSGDIAILLDGDVTKKRDIIIKCKDDGSSLIRINELHQFYDALQYPILFPNGGPGYCVEFKENTRITSMQYYNYMLQLRDGDNLLHRSGDLFNQFLTDMYAKIEGERLSYLYHNQKQLRAEQYCHLRDAMRDEDQTSHDVGSLVILPSSYVGSPRYMHERMQDSMVYVRKYGRPTFFITMTCNPHWDEIKDLIFPGQQFHHRHDIVARVFRIKIKSMIKLLWDYKIFGDVNAYLYTIEWQKRGLPHAHILLWVKEGINPNDLDKVICAEIPDKELDPELYDVVIKNMIHGPCGDQNPDAPCMTENAGFDARGRRIKRCCKRYPRPFVAATQRASDGYPNYRRRSPEDGGASFPFTQQKPGQARRTYTYDNTWVVPYNPVLSRTFKCHINVEYCNSVKAIKYVTKYVMKGTDMAMYVVDVPDEARAEDPERRTNEIKDYREARYISSNEAAWRIFGFEIHDRKPAVERLAVHLENGQRVSFQPGDDLAINEMLDNPKDTTLTGFFKLCQTDRFAQGLLYPDVTHYYTWNRQNNAWKARKQGTLVEGTHGEDPRYFVPNLGRVYTVHPKNEACFCLRMLLHVVRGPTSFEALRTVPGKVCETFKEACEERGLLRDDNEWEMCLAEAKETSSAPQLRALFAIMIKDCEMQNPGRLWEKFVEFFTEDVLYQARVASVNMTLEITAAMKEKALILLEDKLLSMGGQTLNNYTGFPRVERTLQVTQPLIEQELSYDQAEMAAFVEDNLESLQPEQRVAYNTIMAAVETGNGGLFFLDAPGGTGKTFLLSLLLSQVRLSGQIALACASSGIAATLLKGGRTSHSMFKIPLDAASKEEPVCSVSMQDSSAKLFRRTKLIIWDEAVMAHRKGFEAVDKMLRFIRNCDAPFGGIVTVLAGDFRQILPVVPRGTMTDEMNATIKRSRLWRHFKTLKLTTNMRVLTSGDPLAAEFSAKLKKIGEGELPFLPVSKVHKLPCGVFVDSTEELIDKVYPDFENNFRNLSWLKNRAILAPRNDTVDEINHTLLQATPGAAQSYRSVDTALDDEGAMHFPVEFLNSINTSGIPPHNLCLKVGCTVILLRNLSPPKLVNGSRLVITKMESFVVKAKILSGQFEGEEVLIPRLPIKPSDTELSFTFQRLQFPLKLSYAMTINKSQGQTIKCVGLALTQPVFSHGQLYVGCSRVKQASQLFISTPIKGHTENIVYNEILSR